MLETAGLLSLHVVQAQRRPLPFDSARPILRDELACVEAGLRRRGDLTLWMDEAAFAGWVAPKRSNPGGQLHDSDQAVELVLAFRLVFHVGLRQAGAFIRSVLVSADSGSRGNMDTRGVTALISVETHR